MAKLLTKHLKIIGITTAALALQAVISPGDLGASQMSQTENTEVRTTHAPNALARTTTNMTSATWQEPHLRSAFGQVSLTSNVNGWQPLNLGMETSNTSVPVFAIGPKDTVYLANSAGVWRRVSQRWQLMSPIPGSGLSYAIAMTVSKSGTLYLATTGSPDCVWMRTAKGWRAISDRHVSNVRFLAWSPQGQLLVGTNIFPKTSSVGLGPAPTPSLGLFEYVNSHWESLSGLFHGKDTRFLRNIAWSPTGELAIALDNSISVQMGEGWKTISNETVNDLRWWNGMLIAATNHGLQAYDGQRWGALPGMPSLLRNATISNLNSIGDELLVQVQSPQDNSISAWLDVSGVWSQVPYAAVGVRYVGVSPQHVPIIESQGNTPSVQLWQFMNGSWGQLRLPSAATTVINDPTYIDIHQYFPQNVAWSPIGNLTVSTEQHGVWQWNGKSWTMVGGPIDTRHTYSTGNIAYIPNDILVASVKEEIPPPPKTPRMLHNMTWLYSHGHWMHLEYPPGVTENIVQDEAVSPTGDIVMIDDHGGLQIWTYHAGKWNLTADRTNFPEINSNHRVSFAPNGQFIVSEAGFGGSSDNGVYEYASGKWKQILSNPSWLRAKDTYWFYPIWMPDGSMVFSVMNDSGYHLWHYAQGTWSDLGLKNQRIERMFVLPGGWLCAISDAYVCWVRKLS